MERFYQDKLTTAEEAVKLVRSGDRVYVGTASSFAYTLMDALWERRDELENVTILCSMSLKPSKMFGTDHDERNPFTIETFFLGARERVAHRKHGMPLNFSSFHLSQVDLWCREIGRPDVCFLEVSRPDENGYVSFGPSGGCMYTFLMESARTIVLECNAQTPYILGDETSRMHISRADMMILTDSDVSPLPNDEVDEISQQISELVLAEVPDGATIQLGLGKVSTAIGYGLMQRNDLGIFSELFSEPMMHLMKNGNVTNTAKGFMDGKSVFAFSLGTREMYQFMDRNSQIYNCTFPFVNNPVNIAKNKRMISINTAMSVDLFGQVAADSMGFTQQSAVGGQLDFVKGAQMSEGGKSIIALASAFEKNGKLESKICASFPAGTAVTTPRSEVQYVATEYGCINLKHLNMADRVRAMISLAHPAFRDQLTEEAKAHGLI
ncbi:MAG: acetyl-CoA hydrolase [Firmicutes bacterium]|nr:acetyl-CoA hydrolase [Bacillota bacterium]